MSDLLSDLRQAAPSPSYPKGLTPGIVYSGAEPSEVTTPWLDRELRTDEDFAEAMKEMGVPVPDGKRLELVEARFNQAAWHRDQQEIGLKNTAYTAPAWLYRFKVVADSGLMLRADLDILFKQAKKAAPHRAVKQALGGTMIVVPADFQAGKVSVLGGTAELIQRSEIALADMVRQVKKIKPAALWLVDLGDSVEGFFSAPGAQQGNDLSITEQVRVWRRIFWRWILTLAPLVDDMTVGSVPSNHCEAARSSKGRLGPVDDDWGIEVASQVRDLASESPAAYGHVKFVVPAPFCEHITLQADDGTAVSFAHGHQERNAKMLGQWVKKHGRDEIGQSDLVLVGHHHHLRIEAIGDRQFLVVAPTNDPGSDWFTPKSGENSGPGVLSLVAENRGWRDLYISWTDRPTLTES